jgi:hypothetical protein
VNLTCCKRGLFILVVRRTYWHNGNKLVKRIKFSFQTWYFPDKVNILVKWSALLYEIPVPKAGYSYWDFTWFCSVYQEECFNTALQIPPWQIISFIHLFDNILRIHLRKPSYIKLEINLEQPRHCTTTLIIMKNEFGQSGCEFPLTYVV